MLRLAWAVPCILIAFLVADWFDSIVKIALGPRSWAVILGAGSGLAIAVGLLRSKRPISLSARTFSLDGKRISTFPYQAGAAFLSSFVSLLTTVLLTMQVHWMRIDWAVLFSFLAPVILLSVMVAFVFSFLPIGRLGHVIVGGASSAFGIALAYVCVGVPFFAE